MSLDWRPLLDDPLRREPGPASDLWFMACEDFGGCSHLRVTTEGAWRPSDVPAWGPDGDLPGGGETPVSILAAAPLGALIGKIGGSSASHGAASPTSADKGAPGLVEDQAFLLGSSCTFALPAKVAGPLFVGFNCLHRPIEITQPLVVRVEGANPTF